MTVAAILRGAKAWKGRRKRGMTPRARPQNQGGRNPRRDLCLCGIFRLDTSTTKLGPSVDKLDKPDLLNLKQK